MIAVRVDVGCGFGVVTECITAAFSFELLLISAASVSCMSFVCVYDGLIAGCEIVGCGFACCLFELSVR